MLQSHYCFCWGQRFHWFSTRTLASLPLCTQSTKLQQNVCILGKILCHVNGLSEYAGWFLVIQKFPTVMHHSEVCAVAQISQCSQRSFTDYNVCRVLRWLCQASAGESRHALGAPLWWWLVLARPGARITLDCRTGGSEEESGLQGSIMRRGQPDPICCRAHSSDPVNRRKFSHTLGSAYASECYRKVPTSFEPLWVPAKSDSYTQTPGLKKQ